MKKLLIAAALLLSTQASASAWSIGDYTKNTPLDQKTWSNTERDVRNTVKSGGRTYNTLKIVNRCPVDVDIEVELGYYDLNGNWRTKNTFLDRSWITYTALHTKNRRVWYTAKSDDGRRRWNKKGQWKTIDLGGSFTTYTHGLTCN